MEEVLILIRENVLDEMYARRNRLTAQIQTQQEELRVLNADIARHTNSIRELREAYLGRTI